MSTAAAETGSGMEPTVLRAPLFESAVNHLDDGNRHVVVDLGPARSATIDLLGRFRCRLDVLDLPSMLAGIDSETEKSALKQMLADRLPPARGETVGLILCWHLLNYLEPAAIETLVACLARRCGPGTRIHALIEYSARHMDETPGFIAPESAEQLITMPSGNALRPAPRYSARELEKRMPGFAHERTMLLSNGMQEYLFRKRQ